MQLNNDNVEKHAMGGLVILRTLQYFQEKLQQLMEAPIILQGINERLIFGQMYIFIKEEYTRDIYALCDLEVACDE
jgi:hypothetical protein